MKKGAVEIDLYEIWHIIKKHSALIITMCLLCGAISFVSAKYILPKKYEAIAKIIVVKNESGSSNAVTYNDLQTSQKLAATYRQIIMSEAISDKVISNLNLRKNYNISTSEYNKIVSVYAENSTEVLAVKVNTVDPELSANIANEIVKVFISNIYSIYGVQNVSILNNAKVPESNTSPNTTKYTLVGICAGMLISLIIIIIKSFAENKVKSEEDIKEIFELPIIANIPDFEVVGENTITNDGFDAFVTKNHPDSIASEAFRILRTNLSLRDFDEKLQVINVISPTQQEGKSTCVLNLGYVYSQLNKKVLIIDLDLRLPSMHEKMKLKNTFGVTDIIHRKCTISSAVMHYTNNFDILFSGTKTVYASELIQSNAFKELLAILKKQYDIILIDCPPLNMVTDGVISSTFSDGTIMCIAENRDEKRLLLKTRDTIKQLNINMLGIVVTMSNISKSYGGGDYGYGYGYGYGSEAPSKKHKLFSKRSKQK